MLKHSALLLVLLAGIAFADKTKTTDKPEKIYTEKADAEQRITDALDQAQQKHQNILIVWGGNWCPWCLKLHNLFETNKEIAGMLRSEYIVLPIDMKENLKTMIHYKADPKQGVPFLTILSPNGKVIINQETGSLEDGPKHDPKKVLAFLDKHKPKQLDAKKIWKESQEKAKQSKKKLFVRFTAPWCPYCRLMDNFLALKDVRKILADDLIVVAIDRDRMKHGAEVEKEIRKDINSGIPWFAFYGPDGKLIATSESKEGNVGFPVAKDEIAFFNELLKKVLPEKKANEVTKILTKETEELRKKTEK